MHYWAVWHNFKPIEDFRRNYYRFCSEYGFESVPDIKTVLTFADEGRGDLDLCGNVMQAHQKCLLGNEKLMFYLAQTVNYPCDFRRLIYCSQLMQADCIRSSVEHMRRARGRCMGSAYWQLNDSNPVISWSGIDYYGRLKALHYASRRFYAPVLLSCDDSDPASPALYVTNDTREDISVRVICRLRRNTSEVLWEMSADAAIPALSAEKVMTADIADKMQERTDRRTKYLEYELIRDDAVISRGTTLFVRPKEFEFLPVSIKPVISETGDGFEVSLTSDNFAKSVCLSLKDCDCTFSDNWFDIHGSEPVTVALSGTGNLSRGDIAGQLEIVSY